MFLGTLRKHSSNILAGLQQPPGTPRLPRRATNLDLDCFPRRECAVVFEHIGHRVLPESHRHGFPDVSVVPALFTKTRVTWHRGL